MLHELALFSRTFVAFAFRPGRAARNWQEHPREYMNPLGFAAMGATIYWAVASVFAAIWPVPEAERTGLLTAQITSAVGPYLHYGLLGCAMHFALKWLGSRRRILGSVGAALFAGGSIGTLTALLLLAMARWFGNARQTSALELRWGDVASLLIFLAALASYALVCQVMARALLALHRTTSWRIIMAAVFAVVITAVLFGSVLPDGDYGWRPYISIDFENRTGIAFGFRG